MIVGAVCMSHSPLMDRGGADAAVEGRFRSAVTQAASFAAAAAPDLTIVFHPDHLNGFFYGLLPAFCVGIAGRSVGDYGTGAGPLDIPAEVAEDCAAELLRLGIDIALSHRMTADHGAVQPLELLSAGHPPGPMLPVFINCAAPPLPGFPRVRALGAAIGAWAAARPERVLLVGSGGPHGVQRGRFAAHDRREHVRVGVRRSALRHARRQQRPQRALPQPHGECAARRQ